MDTLELALLMQGFELHLQLLQLLLLLFVGWHFGLLFRILWLVRLH